MMRHHLELFQPHHGRGRGKWLTKRLSTHWDDAFHERGAETGMLSQVLGPEWAVIGYVAVVAHAGGSYACIWSGDQGRRLQLGVQARDQAMPRATKAGGMPMESGGGICVCKCPWEAKQQRVPTDAPSAARGDKVVVLRCACEGPWVERKPGGRFACSQLVPIAEVSSSSPDANAPPAHLWRRFASRPHHEAAKTDNLGRMDTAFDWDVIGYVVLVKSPDGYAGLRVGDGGAIAPDHRRFRFGVRVDVAEAKEGGGGFHVCNTAAAAAQLLVPRGLRDVLRPARRSEGDIELAIVRCACSRPFVSYDRGVVACSRLTPLEEVPVAAAGVASVAMPWPLHRPAVAPPVCDESGEVTARAMDVAQRGVSAALQSTRRP